MRPLRLFVALYPTPDVAARLAGAAAGLDLPAHRPVPAAQIHMTLQFIGDCPAGELETTIESVQRAASGIGAFELRPQRLFALPERGPSRLVAASTDAPPGLLEMKRRLVTRLARDPRRSERKAFLPHLTLLRFRSPSRFKLDQALETIDPFPVAQIALMRSQLRPDGARHVVVETVPL